MSSVEADHLKHSEMRSTPGWIITFFIVVIFHHDQGNLEKDLGLTVPEVYDHLSREVWYQANKAS